MFSNGTQIKSKFSAINLFDARQTRRSQKEAKVVKSSLNCNKGPKISLASQLNEKLNGSSNIKDNLAKSLARMLHSATNTLLQPTGQTLNLNSSGGSKKSRASSLTGQFAGDSLKRSSQISGNESGANSDSAPTSGKWLSTRRMTSAAATQNENEKLIWGQSKSNRSSLRKRTSADPSAGSGGWSLKSSVKRSLSLRVGGTEKSRHGQLAQFRRQRSSGKAASVAPEVTAAKWIEGWSANNKRLLRGAMGGGKSSAHRKSMKRSNWLPDGSSSKGKATNNRLSLINAIFILIHLFICCCHQVRAAPLPAGGLQPVWLEDGLISGDQLDSRPIELLWPQDQGNFLGSSNNDNSNNENNDNINKELYWSPEQSEQQPPNNSDGSGSNEELLWVQRRRLERDRALEPAPWLREQPMRRGSSPALVEAEDLDLNQGNPPAEMSEAAGKEPTGRRSLRGRQSRQLADEFLDELLRSLLESTLGEQRFADALYEELEARLRSQQSPGYGAGSGLLATDQLQPSDQRRLMQTATTSTGPLAISHQQQQQAEQAQLEPEATLVVIGDEVSSDNEENQRPVKSQPLILGNSGETIQVDGFNQLPGDGSASARLMAEPEAMSLGRGPLPLDLLSVDPPSSGEQMGELMGGAQSSPMANSFHVIEDIDQPDPVSHQVMVGPVDASGQLQQPAAGSAFNWQPARLAQGITQVKRAAISRDQQLGSLKQSTGRLGPVDQMQIAKMAIDSGLFSREQSIRTLTKLKNSLEDRIDIPRSSILGLYPINSELLMVKLDTTKLSSSQMINLANDYDITRGFMILKWGKGSQQSPLPLLSAILHDLAAKEAVRSGNSSNELEKVDWPLGVDQLPAHEANDEQLVLEGDNNSDGPAIQQQGQSLAMEVAPSYYLSATSASHFGPKSDDYTSGSRLTYRPLASFYQDPASPSIPAASWRQLLAGSGLLLPAGFRLTPTSLGFGRLLHPAPTSSESVAGASDGDQEDGSGFLGLHFAYLLAIAGALLVIFLAVKLVTVSRSLGRSGQLPFGRGRRHGGSFWSLWSAGSSSMEQSGEVASPDNRAPALKAAPIERKLSQDSGLSSGLPQEVGGKSYNLDLLTQRLANLLQYQSSNNNKEQAEVAQSDDRKELDEASAQEESSSSEQQTTTSVPSAEVGGGNSHFRSSGSYIKSLIEVLTKAKAQINGQPSDSSTAAGATSGRTTGRQTGSQRNGAAADSMDECISDLELAASSGGRQVAGSEQEAGIVMSQMDISAAHLILAYMEKHLEDKERLRREWLELNQATGASGKSSQVNSPGGKIVQLMLQKLAKVALSDENRSKNRNNSVVPFDRNRVKLGGRWSAAKSSAGGSFGSSGSVLAIADRTTGNKRAQLKGPAGGRRRKGTSGSSDYINASYIYDDDLRKPTHIIAQGPTEQTSGQFWQMIWEQGISVIVMLTRLNENSIKMCHCYWPTSSCQPDEHLKQQPSASASNRKLDAEQAPANGQQLDQLPAGNGQQPTGSGSAAAVAPTNQSASNGRRVSVTSVFTATGACLSPSGQPIIANGDLSNNMLSFDVHSDSSLDAAEDEDEAANEASNEGGGSSRLARGSETSGRKQQAPAATRFEVHLVSEHVSSGDYLVRNMYMINRSTGETRTISQFHYLSWPDNGVPDNVKSFLQFRRMVHKSYRNLRSPILVHCSDGGGRSGTYTLIDIILERIRLGAKEIDPRATLEHLRDQRTGLCATQRQFEFVLVALAEEIQIILNALPQ